MAFILSWFRGLRGSSESDVSIDRTRRKLAKYEAALKAELKRWCDNAETARRL